ncbi:MAG TPA: allantoinase AllB [Thermomicrobiales bacterium]|nr:allantoinase AllB [Thermomicrobiales bacterium]
MPTTLVRGGTLATIHGVFRADIVIRDGVIAALTADAGDLAADETIDATGLTILPGGVDPHTHMREPSKRDREGFATGTAAAAAGGITTIVEMPQADPPATDGATFRQKRELAEAHALIDVALYGGAVGQPRAQIDEQFAAGAVAFKSFMCNSSPSYPAVDDAQLYDALLAVADLDSFLTVHAENDALLQTYLRRLREAGRHDNLAHCESRPPFVEAEAVRRAIYLAGEAGAHVHIAHVSAAQSLLAIEEAKADGHWVTAETCPQYLLMTEEDVDRLGPYARCAPAIRTRDHVEAMWRGLGDGTLDFVCSDHAPYETAEKEAGRASIWEAPLGLNIIQVMYPAVLDEALHAWGFPLELCAAITATNAARIFGLYPRKGTIQVGADADLACYDFDREWTVRAADLFTKHKWTPLDGRRVRGRVVRTISRGRTVYLDGRITAEPGSGRFVTRRQTAGGRRQ